MRCYVCQNNNRVSSLNCMQGGVLGILLNNGNMDFAAPEAVVIQMLEDAGSLNETE